MRNKKKLRAFIRNLILTIPVVAVAGFLIPENFKIPVAGASAKSYDQNSFWFYPWGKSVTHKGVDIFAKKGTAIYPATSGLILYRGKNNLGGNVVLLLGPKWRLHYYAHLDSIFCNNVGFISNNSILGTVGNSGNAAGKPSHLHYTIRTIIPFPWQMDKSVQGWKKMFYINPTPLLNKCTNFSR